MKKALQVVLAFAAGLFGFHGPARRMAESAEYDRLRAMDDAEWSELAAKRYVPTPVAWIPSPQDGLVWPTIDSGLIPLKED